MPDFAINNAITPQRIWFRFLRIRQRAYGIMTRRLKDIGLSIAQFDLLSTLTESEGLSQRDLAERLYVTKGNVSGLVDRLVEAGLVDRRAIQGDRRSYALYLTQEGHRLAQVGMEAQRLFVEQTLGKLSQQDLVILDGTINQWRDALKLLEGESRNTQAMK